MGQARHFDVSIPECQVFKWAEPSSDVTDLSKDRQLLDNDKEQNPARLSHSKNSKQDIWPVTALNAKYMPMEFLTIGNCKVKY